VTANSPLTAGERSIVLMLAVGAMSERASIDAEAAEEALNGYELHLRGDDHDVTLEVAGQALVRASRAWLTEHDGYQR
jgi:hypothetical protein